jgi:Zn-dependent peptidase ImmA (M78 family)
MAAVGRARQGARELIKKHKIVKPPIDLEYLLNAEAPGFVVILDDTFPDHLSGLTNAKAKTIRINSNHPPLRRRFSLAHELGHIVLGHSGMLFQRIDEENIKEELEREADEFAGELLMPIRMFKACFELDPNLDTIAGLFAVSRTAAYVRAMKLRLL